MRNSPPHAVMKGVNQPPLHEGPELIRSPEDLTTAGQSIACKLRCHPQRHPQRHQARGQTRWWVQMEPGLFPHGCTHSGPEGRFEGGVNEGCRHSPLKRNRLQALLQSFITPMGGYSRLRHHLGSPRQEDHPEGPLQGQVDRTQIRRYQAVIEIDLRAGDGLYRVVYVDDGLRAFVLHKGCHVSFKIGAVKLVRAKSSKESADSRPPPASKLE